MALDAGSFSGQMRVSLRNFMCHPVILLVDVLADFVFFDVLEGILE